MAVDTKPNFSSNKFEQCTEDIMNLSGCTQVFGTFDVQPSGSIDSCSGYMVSGTTIFDTGVNINTLQIGCNAVANGICAIAIGANACVTQACSIAIGTNSQSQSSTSIAIGNNTKVSGNTSVHVGVAGCSFGNGNAILGYNAIASGLGVAVGSGSHASTTNTVAIGYTSCALCQHGIAIGGSVAKSCHQAAIAIGSNTEASGVDSISIGYFSLSRNFYSIALGYNSCATGHTSIAIGCDTKAVGFASIVLGSCGSCANNTCALVIGANSCSTGVDSITIGANAKSIGNCGMAFGKNAAVTGTSGIAIGNSAAVTVLNAVAIGCSAYANSSSGVVIGNTACAIQNQAVAIGFGTTACGYQSIAIGQQASTTGNTSIAIGLCSKSSENESIAIGTGARTLCGCGIAIGYNNISCATNGNILGGYSNILGATNNSATLVGASNVKLTGATSYSGYVVVPNFAILCTPSGSGNILCWDSTTKKVELTTGGGGSTASGERISKTITQASHGFTVKDVVGFSGTTYNKAIADGTYDGEVLGLVTSVPDGSTFVLTQAGYVTGLTSLVANTTYFLSDATAGLLTTTEPTTEGSISKTVLFANSTTTGWVLPYVGYIVTTGSSGGGSWGTIVGTLSDQTDLQDALDAKADDIYTLNSPATCIVGGVSPGYVLTGKSLACIIQDAFAPYVPPTFSAFAVNVTSPMEVGALLGGSKSFSWTATAGGNVCASSVGICEIGGSLLGSGFNYNSSPQSLDIGVLTNNSPTTWTWRISGCSTQSTAFCRDVSKSSIYPYMWGVVTSGSCPTITSTLINTGNKVVCSVGTTVSVNFASSNQWTWFAMPCACLARTKWFVAVGNCGFVDRGNPSDKYPNSCSLLVTDTVDSCWSSVCYTVYMSGFAATDAEAIAFRTY